MNANPSALKLLRAKILYFDAVDVGKKEIFI